MTAREFTSAPDPEDVNPLDGVTFTLDGTEFQCGGRLSILDLSDLARKITDAGEDTPEAQAGMAATMSSSLVMALGEAEYARFRAHVRTHRTPDRVVIDIMQMINEAIQAAVEQVTARPTRPSSPSSTGAGDRAEQISRVVSAGFAEVHVIPPPEGHQQPKAKGSARGRGRQAAG
jgi:hypothetical protein